MEIPCKYYLSIPYIAAAQQPADGQLKQEIQVNNNNEERTVSDQVQHQCRLFQMFR
jgi:hypothetical protein